ncbi:MAG: hypothetical protein V1890_06695 [Candidatus Zixiibacteriota bacterium]
MKKWMIGLTLLLLLSILFSACGKLSKKGTAPANIAPEVFLVNIPPESSEFETLIQIYWYGFDQDGYISRYQYLVILDTGLIIPKDILISNGDTLVFIEPEFVQFIEMVGPEDWNDSAIAVFLTSKGYTGITRSVVHAIDSVGNSAGTWDKVMFFASLDTSIGVSQYFFVRAVDNEGAVSKIWKPDSEKGSNFRLFKRTNIPPNTAIKYDTLIVEYCLPDTTTDWGGIKISWSGTDPDYGPRAQPPLTYSWKLYGPYASKPPKDIDTTKDLYYSSWDNITNSPWVDSTSRLLVDLENAPGEDFGWYQFRVRARDDAFVPDPTPAVATFKIIKPPFLFSNQRAVLLVDATNYQGGLIIPKKDSIRSFYRALLDSLVPNIIDRYSFYRVPLTSDIPSPPPEDTLSHYKCVIYFNEGRFSGIVGATANHNDSGFIQIEKYLRVGGRVWMIGQNNWDVNVPPDPSYIAIKPGGSGYTSTVVRVANYFCGVTGIFHPALDSRNRNEEMTAAEPYLPYGAGLPRLEVDTLKLSTRYYDGIFPADKPLKGIARANWESIWNANYNQRLYTFISYKGSESSLHGRACASRAYSPNSWTFTDENGEHILQWRTAEFCFPAFAMKRDQMLDLMKVMVSWFMQDEVNP